MDVDHSVLVEWDALQNLLSGTAGLDVRGSLLSLMISAQAFSSEN